MQKFKLDAPIKVLHVAETTHGGIAAYWEELAGMESVQHSFLCPEVAENTAFLAGAAGYYGIADTGRGLGRLWRLGVRLRQVLCAEKFDVVFLHSTFAGVVGRLAVLNLLFKQRPKVVYCAHGWAFTMPVARWKQWLYGAVERILLPFTAAVVNISRFEADAAARFGIGGKKCHLVNNGITATTELGAPPALNFDKNTVNYLFVGRFHAAKGADILAELAEYMRKIAPQVRFHIVGDALAGNEDKINFPANCIVHGWQPRELLPAYFAACDGVIVPSRWEAFSLVAVEALRAGKPIFVSENGALPEFLAAGAGGKVLFLDDLAACAEILARYSKPELTQMGAGNKKVFAANYTRELFQARLLTVLDGVL